MQSCTCISRLKRRDCLSLLKCRLKWTRIPSGSLQGNTSRIWKFIIVSTSEQSVTSLYFTHLMHTLLHHAYCNCLFPYLQTILYVNIYLLMYLHIYKPPPKIIDHCLISCGPIYLNVCHIFPPVLLLQVAITTWVALKGIITII